MTTQEAQAFSISVGFVGLYTPSSQDELNSALNSFSDLSLDVFGTAAGIEYHINGEYLNGYWYSIGTSNVIYSGATSNVSPSGCLNVYSASHNFVTQSGDCNAQISFIVELPFTPLPPTTSAPISPEDICVDFINVTDSYGNLIKRACLIPVDVAPFKAYEYAIAAGFLGLYQITSQNDIDALSGLNYPNAEFIVSGYKNVDGDWVYHGSNLPLFTGAIPTSGIESCLSIVDNGAGGFVTKTTNCGEDHWYVVELPLPANPSTVAPTAGNF
jgi:hypothetical protein